VRAEHYSDFGDNVSGKLSVRFNFTDDFALRGSVQNGFRAPSLQQQFFAATSTNFNSVGVPFDVITFPVTDPVAVALGAQPLDAEESVNFSVGAVLQLGDLSITVDAYRIDIDDRIVLSENLTQDNVRNYLVSQGFVGVDGVRFFLNGVDTETKGIDVVMNYPFTAGESRFDLTLTGNFNSTDVTRVPITPQLAALNPAPVLFDRLNVKAFEEGSPESKFTAGVNWTLDRFGATVRAIRYGESLTPANSAALDFVNEAATLVDVEARFDVTESVQLALGADNVFDEYPEPLPTALNTTGNAPFSNYSPFGRSGRFVYGRIGLSF
jgi:iron complex outermembrane receptor protein